MIETSLDGVERALAGLWEAASGTDAFARVFTLVAVCATPDELARARAALPAVASQHPCRTVTVTCYPGAPPSISARVGLHMSPQRRDEPRGDDIDLDVRGDARSWVPSAITKLRVADLPLYVWWVGDLPDDDRLFDHLLEVSDVAVVHSCDMDLRDLEALSRLISISNGAWVISDLTWTRLRAWQDFTARFFDDPAARPHAASLRTVTVSLAPRQREREATSTQAALFGGWIAAALGWDVSDPTWSRDGDAETATVRDAKGEAVSLRFVTLDREGVYPGALYEVTLESPTARFVVTRSPDDALVLCWSAEGDGVNVASQCVRIGTPEEPKMLHRALERPLRDAMFERSIAAAARLVAPVSAKRSA